MCEHYSSLPQLPVRKCDSLRAIFGSRKEAETAFSRFLTVFRPKYPKAAECLEKDREALLAFYEFPAENWIPIRTTNPIESTFATVRLRTVKTLGCVSRESILAMVFMLVKSTQRRWLK
jgi:putative transposase